MSFASPLHEFVHLFDEMLASILEKRKAAANSWERLAKHCWEHVKHDRFLSSLSMSIDIDPMANTQAKQRQKRDTERKDEMYRLAPAAYSWAVTKPVPRTEVKQTIDRALRLAYHFLCWRPELNRDELYGQMLNGLHPEVMSPKCQMAFERATNAAVKIRSKLQWYIDVKPNNVAVADRTPAAKTPRTRKRGGQLSSLREGILTALYELNANAKNCPQSSTDISKHLSDGTSPDAIKQAVGQLKTRGLIKSIQTSQGGFYLTPKGIGYVKRHCLNTVTV